MGCGGSGCLGGAEAGEVKGFGHGRGHGYLSTHHVAKASGQGFIGAVPVVFAIAQNGQGFVKVQPGLVGIGAGHAFGVAVKQIGLVAHVNGVAPGVRPRGVNHHLGVFGHGDGFTRHGQVAGATDGNAVNLHVNLRGVALQGVVDG